MNILADASSSNAGLIVSVLIAMIGSIGLVGGSIASTRRSDKAASTAEGKADEAGHSADFAKLMMQQMQNMRDEERHLLDGARELYETLRQQYDTLVSDLAETRERLERVEQEKQALEERVDHLEGVNRDLVVERDRLRRRVALLSSEVEKLGGHVPPEVYP